MTSHSLTYNEEHDIPSPILKTILDCMHQNVIHLGPQYVWFLVHLYVGLTPNFIVVNWQN